MIINERYKSVLPPLTADEFNSLERSIITDGIREPLVVWGDTLIDGHNRFTIAQKYDISFNTVNKDFADDDDVKVWILENQSARRNLTDEQRTYNLGYLYELRKKKNGGTGANQFSKEQLPQNEGAAQIHETAKIIADDNHVSRATVERAADYKAAVDIIADNVPALKDKILSGGLFVTKAETIRLSKMDQSSQSNIVEHLSSGEAETIAEVIREIKPHVAQNSGNNEWYTPSDYIEAARTVLGAIDLDPASSDLANETVKAVRYYTLEDSGLAKDWSGRVWMNPPYSSELIPLFAEKLARHYRSGDVSEAVVLVNNATETAWFNELISVSSAVIFPKTRVKFHMPDGKTGSPLQGQAVLYLGDKPNTFLSAFQNFGWGAYFAR
ncbi:hypothetical protein FACS1894105_02560 [Clostridia bacterium]|nr:hypothetical protein FACS1894105_02560 [Clostridia bacterium]